MTSSNQHAQWVKFFCKFVIDLRSYDNLVFKKVVNKLGLTMERHPNLYKLTWLKLGSEVIVVKQSFVNFSIGQNNNDRDWCDMTALGAYYILLGRL